MSRSSTASPRPLPDQMARGSAKLRGARYRPEKVGACGGARARRARRASRASSRTAVAVSRSRSVHALALQRVVTRNAHSSCKAAQRQCSHRAVASGGLTISGPLISHHDHFDTNPGFRPGTKGVSNHKAHPLNKAYGQLIAESRQPPCNEAMSAIFQPSSSWVNS